MPVIARQIDYTHARIPLSKIAHEPEGAISRAIIDIKDLVACKLRSLAGQCHPTVKLGQHLFLIEARHHYGQLDISACPSPVWGRTIELREHGTSCRGQRL